MQKRVNARVDEVVGARALSVLDSPGIRIGLVAVASVALTFWGVIGFDTVLPGWTLAMFVAVLVFADWMTPPGTLTNRAETPVFALVVASVVLYNPVISSGLILLTVVTGETFRPAAASEAISVVMRALLSVVLVAAGALVMNVPQLVPFLFLLWLGFIGYWMVQHGSIGNRSILWRHGAMLAWVGLMLTMPYTLELVPHQMQIVMMAGVPVLHFALGFMTVDTGLVTVIGWRTAGRAGNWFWLRELVPTFTRYNLMALAGAGLTSAGILAGMSGLSFGLVILLLMFMFVREHEIGHRRMVATVCLMASALEARDSYTKGHADRVSSYAVAIAEHLGWTGRSRRDLELAAHLHDIGKVGVPDDVLLKPGTFTDQDFEIMKTHSAIGAGIVQNSPEVRHVAPIVRQHHERLDGSGYPDGLSESSIVPAARIIGVADAFDAMTSNRPYRNAMDKTVALGIIERGKGTEFDSDVVDALLELADKKRLEAALQFGYCLTH